MLLWEIMEGQGEEASMSHLVTDKNWRYQYELMLGLTETHMVTHRNHYRCYKSVQYIMYKYTHTYFLTPLAEKT